MHLSQKNQTFHISIYFPIHKYHFKVPISSGDTQPKCYTLCTEVILTHIDSHITVQHTMPCPTKSCPGSDLLDPEPKR